MRPMRTIIAEILKRWGPRKVKQRIWDAEYAGGEWDYLREATERATGAKDPVYMFLDKYCAGATVLDLGCGIGYTVLEMTDAFREYVGVDISIVAIDRANAALQSDSKRAQKSRFLVSDLTNFVPDRQFSVILFRESIYYFPVGELLNRCCPYLAPGGVFIIRLYNRYKFKGIVDFIETNFHLIERYAPRNSAAIIIVCSPRG